MPRFHLYCGEVSTSRGGARSEKALTIFRRPPASFRIESDPANSSQFRPRKRATLIETTISARGKIRSRRRRPKGGALRLELNR
jgi:hypothetical protein